MNKIFPFIITVTFLAACGDKPQNEAAPVDSLQENVLRITDAQYKASNISLGRIERRSIASPITVNGKLDVPPQNVVIISAPFGGFVKSTGMLPGMQVKKGDVLAILENPEYIQLQQDYLDSRSKLVFLEKEYIRQQELAKENVNAQKTLQQSASQYESMRAIVSGLEAKLTMIGISSASITSGKINSTIRLLAPMSGFIVAVNVTIGQFVTPTDVLFKIVNLDHMHVELKVYEKDIGKISPGQRVVFRLANDTTSYKASVRLVGKEIGVDRTVSVHCHLDRQNVNSLLPGMFVTAVVEVEPKEKEIVPALSLVSFEGKDYIFVMTGNNQFNAIPVRVGNTTDGFTQIHLMEVQDTGAPVVINGAFALMGLLKNKQE